MKEAIYDINRLKISREGVQDFYWPIEREELTTVRDAFLESFVNHLRTEGPANRQCQIFGLLLSGLLGEVLAAYQAQALIRRARAAGREPKFASSAKLAQALSNGRIPGLRSTVSILSRGVPKDLLWRQSARVVRDHFQRRIVRQPFLEMLDMNHDIVTIATGDMIEQHATAVGGVNYLGVSNWFTPLGSSEMARFAGPLTPINLSPFLSSVERAFKAGNEPLDTATIRYLSNWLSEAYDLADRYLGRILSAPQRVPKMLWRGTGGLIWALLLSFACRELGGKVTGHDHSHGQAAWRSYSDTILELPFCDRFMVWTKLQRDLARSNIRAELMIPGELPELEPVPGLFRKKIDPATISHNAQPSGRTVMYVGTLYQDDFVPFSPLHPPVVLVDWEARLFQRLREWGYEVFVKPHPESLNKTPANMFEDTGARLIEGRFEDVCGQADILIFAQTNSTPFFGALGTSQPIVLPNLPLNPWQSKAHNLATLRCTFAETTFDKFNRLQTNFTSLEDALNRAPDLNDGAFFQEFFAHQNEKD